MIQELNKKQIMNISGVGKDKIVSMVDIVNSVKIGTLGSATAIQTSILRARAHSPTRRQIRVVHTPPNIKKEYAAATAARRSVSRAYSSLTTESFPTPPCFFSRHDI